MHISRETYTYVLFALFSVVQLTSSHILGLIIKRKQYIKRKLISVKLGKLLELFTMRQ